MNIKKIIILFIILLIDQVTKFLVAMNDTFISVINNFFYIDYTSNTGAAFSILSGHNIILILISLVMCVVLYHFMYSYKEGTLTNLAFGMLFGGILGNLADRLFIGYVRDFISFKFGNYYFPTFNIADIGITVGVLLLFIVTIKEELSKRGNKSRRPSKRKA